MPEPIQLTCRQMLATIEGIVTAWSRWEYGRGDDAGNRAMSDVGSVQNWIYNKRKAWKLYQQYGQKKSTL